MIELKNIYKNYGEREVLKDVSFSLSLGEIVGLLGVNGSGKTSSLNIAAAYSPATSGRVLIDGIDTILEPEKARKKLGYLPENLPLYEHMYVSEYLKYIAEIKGLDSISAEQESNRVLKLVDIMEVKDRLINNLSKGYRQRLGIAQALVADPPILIFDEPAIGLDPRQNNNFRQLLLRLKKDHAILISSHILSEIEEICDRVYILHNKRVLSEEEIHGEASKKSDKSKRFVLKIKADKAELSNYLQQEQAVLSYNINSKKTGNDFFEVTIVARRDIRENLFSVASTRGWTILEMYLLKEKLEDVFLGYLERDDV